MQTDSSLRSFEKSDLRSGRLVPLNTFKAKFSLVVVTLFLLSPRVHFFELSFVPSALRFDVIALLITVPLLCLINIEELIKLLIKYRDFTLVFILFSLSFLASSVGKGSFLLSLGQLSIYFSLLVFYFLGTLTVEHISGRQAAYFVGAITLTFCLMHLTYLAISNFYEINTVLRFGLFELPAPFALMCGVTIFTLLPYIVEKSVILLCGVIGIALALSDSRIGLGAFVICLVGLYSLFGRYRSVLLFLLCVVFLNFIFGGKALSFWKTSLLDDPSLSVRLVNFFNYVGWVDLTSLLFGGGAYSFLEYSIQFGKPAHLDSLVIRILSDHGMIFTACLAIWCAVQFLVNVNVLVRAVIGYVFLFSIFNETVVTLKAGHFCFFCLGIIVAASGSNNANVFRFSSHS